MALLQLVIVSNHLTFYLSDLHNNLQAVFLAKTIDIHKLYLKCWTVGDVKFVKILELFLLKSHYKSYQPWYWRNRFQSPRQGEKYRTNVSTLITEESKADPPIKALDFSGK